MCFTVSVLTQLGPRLLTLWFQLSLDVTPNSYLYRRRRGRSFNLATSAWKTYQPLRHVKYTDTTTLTYLLSSMGIDKVDGMNTSPSATAVMGPMLDPLSTRYDVKTTITSLARGPRVTPALPWHRSVLPLLVIHCIVVYLHYTGTWNNSHCLLFTISY